jgi:hypothetical protein
VKLKLRKATRKLARASVKIRKAARSRRPAKRLSAECADGLGAILDELRERVNVLAGA